MLQTICFAICEEGGGRSVVVTFYRRASPMGAQHWFLLASIALWRVGLVQELSDALTLNLSKFVPIRNNRHLLHPSDRSSTALVPSHSPP